MDKFKEASMLLAAAEHLKTRKEYDAALLWTEDITESSAKICLRELLNFDGKHEDTNVVCVYFLKKCKYKYFEP